MPIEPTSETPQSQTAPQTEPQTAPEDAPQPKPGLPLWVTVPLLVVAAVALTVSATRVFRSAPPRPTPMASRITIPPEAGIAVPDFSLVDMNGTPIDATLLDGHYTVMDFFFTNCPFACPGMAQQMARVQSATRGSELRLLSVSVDGDNDTPAVVRAYADRIGADPRRWTLATGDPAVVADLCRNGLKLALSVDPARTIPLEGGATMANIEHPTRLILVGPDRRVLAMASYLIDEEVDEMIEMIRRLAV
ncbi:MAG: SCO family protein [Planctomycetota bacterium]